MSFDGILSSKDRLGNKNPYNSSLIRERQKDNLVCFSEVVWMTIRKENEAWEVLPQLTQCQQMLEAKEISRLDMK